MMRVFFICAMLCGILMGCGQSVSKDSLLEDYDYFFSQLEQIHPDPYSAFGSEENFKKEVRQLRNELAGTDSLTLDEMQSKVTQLLSALHDCHTYMGYDSSPKKVEDRWIPLKFKVIPGSIIVNGFSPELKFLKGRDVQENAYKSNEVYQNTQTHQAQSQARAWLCA